MLKKKQNKQKKIIFYFQLHLRWFVFMDIINRAIQQVTFFDALL